MDYGSIKSIVLCGNLKENNGILTLKIPFDEIKNGQWQMCIIDIGSETLEKVNSIALIRSNFIRDIQYNDVACLETYYPTLTIYHLKGEINSKRVVHLEKNWFWINNLSDTLKLYFEYSDTNKQRNKKLIELKCFMTVNVLLQRKI